MDFFFILQGEIPVRPEKSETKRGVYLMPEERKSENNYAL